MRKVRLINFTMSDLRKIERGIKMLKKGICHLYDLLKLAILHDLHILF